MGEWEHIPISMHVHSEMAEALFLLDEVIPDNKGRVTIQEVLEAHRLGLCWIYATREDSGRMRSVAVMRVRDFPSGLRVLDIEFAVGKLDDFVGKMEKLGEDLAREFGCHKIQIEGRPGWLRALGPGWSEFSRTIEKEVNYG